MSDSYAKLFSSITNSTVWGESSPTRVVWITMLAMKRKDGCVYSSIPGLARVANVSRKECETALAAFLAPDADSRTKDHEGRRIEEIDGGWVILNAKKFDAIRNVEERREYMRDWQRDHRAKAKAVNSNVDKVNDNHLVDRCNPTSTSTNTNSKKANQKQKKPPAAPLTLFEPPDWVDSNAWKGFVEMRKKTRHPMTQRAAELVVAKLFKLRNAGQDPTQILDQSVRNDWRDVFPLREEQSNANNIRNRESTADRAARFAKEGDEREAHAQRGDA